jgi:hypothetical protein
MNFATLGLDLFGIALLLLPAIFITFLPMLIMWLTFREGERMWRGVEELIEQRMRG